MKDIPCKLDLCFVKQTRGFSLYYLNKKRDNKYILYTMTVFTMNNANVIKIIEFEIIHSGPR